MEDNRNRVLLSRVQSETPFSSTFGKGTLDKEYRTRLQRELSDTPFYIGRHKDGRKLQEAIPLRQQFSVTPKESNVNQITSPTRSSLKGSRPSKDPRRIVSLDSSAYKIYKESKKKKKKSKRSISTGEEDPLGNVMNRLSFENVDVVNTPLSAQRSCSEYNKPIQAIPFSSLKVEDTVPRSFWSRMFSWGSGRTQHAHKVHFSSLEDEQSYLVESFRFNSANLMEGENYDYSDNSRIDMSGKSFDGGIHTLGEPSCIAFPFSSPGGDCATVPNTSSGRRDSSRRSDVQYLSSQSAAARRRSTAVEAYKGGSYSAMLYESSVALDYIFGLRHYTNSYGSSGDGGMEIELKNLKEPQLFVPYYSDNNCNYYADRYYRGDASGTAGDETTERVSIHLPRVFSLEDIMGINNTNGGLLLLHGNHSTGSNSGGGGGAPGLRRVGSFHSLGSGGGDQLGGSGHGRPGVAHHHHQHHLHSNNHSGTSTPTVGGRATPQQLQLQQQLQRSAWEQFSLYDRSTYLPVVATVLRSLGNKVRVYYPSDRADDFFYESIRIQPFSSGAYLRGMLWAGFCSLFFNVYNFASWPDLHSVAASSVLDNGEAVLTAAASTLTSGHKVYEMVLYTCLLAQLVLNLLQLPFRLKIHFLCWESSRAVEVDVAINVIRTMLAHDCWILNRALGDLLDLLCITNLVLSELYLWATPRSDPLCSLVVSLCATNLLAFVSRVMVATAFSLSMHDPQVLSDARRRGLSKWDLEVLPTFLYTRPEEVTNEDCSICLGSFDMGEMLISLPCDQKHSFHAQCIRQWLQRQNSCPLCQKLV